MSTFNLIKRVAVYLKKYRWKLLLSFMCTITGALLNVAFPEFVRRIADTFSAGLNSDIDTDAIMRYSFIALLTMIGGFVFIFLQNVLLPMVSQLMSRDIRTDLNRKIDRIPLAYFDVRQNGDTLSRLTTDVDMFANAVTNNLSSIISAVVALTGAHWL